MQLIHTIFGPIVQAQAETRRRNILRFCTPAAITIYIVIGFCGYICFDFEPYISIQLNICSLFQTGNNDGHNNSVEQN